MIERLIPGQVAPADVVALAETHVAAFRTVAALDETLQRYQPLFGEGIDAPLACVLHVARVDGAIRAKAITWLHTIRTQAGPMEVLTLAGVSAHPDVQGTGRGRAVVLDALSRLDEEPAALCLFQTGPARGFYEKLGARVVPNRFFGTQRADRPPKPGRPEGFPWWDEVVMVYPADADWPEGDVDINGYAW